jgi:uncharacterized membrane protein YagU involved in acid resistance
VKDAKLNLGSRLLIGAIAGIAGTVAMTSLMSRLHRRLPEEERYPLTPREIVDSVADQAGLEPSDAAAKDVTTAAHFAYGAASGALIAAVHPRIRPVAGAVAGAGVWAISYLGWVPGFRILKSATDHPARRNALMIGVHLVWGAATAAYIQELLLARETMMKTGDDRDAPPAKTPPLDGEG